MRLQVATVEEFADLLIKSRLVSQSQCETLTASYRKEYVTSAITGDSITSWSAYLVKNGALTCWQCSKIRQRQYKGFFLDKFKIMDYHGHSDDQGIYLAQNMDSKQIVRLSIEDAIKRKDGKTCSDYHGHPSYKVLGPI